MNILGHFGIKDLIDILLVAYFLFQTYILMKKSGATALFSGIMSFILIWILVSQILEMRLLGAILDKFMSFGIIVLIVLFQDEIRRFLSEFGTNGGLMKFISKLFSRSKSGTEKDQTSVMPIVLACMSMSKSGTGALIAVKGVISLNPYIESGEEINGKVSARLIENIFFKNTPLHDGAVIIDGDMIVAASCILPVAQNHNIPPELGASPPIGVRTLARDRRESYYCIGRAGRNIGGLQGRVYVEYFRQRIAANFNKSRLGKACFEKS